LRAGRQGIWTRRDGDARELWVSDKARVVGRPAMAPDGRVAFTVSERGKTLLYVMNSDGKNVRLVTDALALRGDPAWSPDGRWLVSAAVLNGEPRLMRISLRGESSLPLVSEYSVDPLWSPDGNFLLYYGADVGTSFPVRAAAADGRPYPIAALMLPRGSRIAFTRDPQTLFVLRVDPGHMTLLQVDLPTGRQRTLYELPGTFIARDFDVAPDGREIVLDRVEGTSDVALIERTQ
jgi:WD40 repeat protein